jgi:hypothetical protein
MKFDKLIQKTLNESGWDSWLDRHNPAEQEDEEICDKCDEPMEYRGEAEQDEDGNVSHSGSWHCPNCEAHADYQCVECGHILDEIKDTDAETGMWHPCPKCGDTQTTDKLNQD